MYVLLVKLLLLVAVVECAANGESSENSVVEQQLQNYPAESRFKKFLNLFGIGSSNQLERGDLPRAYQQYGYPCAVTTTTTPASVPLLCPFPPMLPNQLNSRNPLGGYAPSPGSHLPLHIGIEPHPPPTSSQLVFPPPPYPAGTPPLLPQNGSKPQFPQPGFHPQSPFPGQPPFIPEMKPDHALPSSPPFPGQSIPTPIPIQNLPQPIQPGQSVPATSSLPTFPGPLYPSNIGLPQNTDKPNNPTLVANSGVNPEQPTPVNVDPVDPEHPIKVSPVITNPLDPVKVNPSLVDPTKPVQVNPINIKPNNPVIIDPVQARAPLLASPSNDQPLAVNPFRPYMNDKGFSKSQPPKFPYGPMNVLINPGFPLQDKPQPTPPTGTSPGKPEIPKEIPGKTPMSSDPHLTNALPYLDGYSIIGPIKGSQLPPHLGNNPIFLGPMSPHGINQFPPHQSLVHPPLNNNNIPPPPPPPSPATTTPLPPPPPPFPPKRPESTKSPLCGSPFLRPYVPPGFHLSSINQFIALPPPNSRFVYPCPTLDLLKTLDFKIMRSLIQESGLLPLFEHTTNYTLFVPSDAAFRRLPRWFRESLEVDKKLKKALVLNHLVKDDLSLDRLENEELVLTARPGGHRIRINIYQQENTYRTITVDGSEVEKGDILTSTGRVHIVNKVIMPNLPRNAAQFLSEKLEFENFWNLLKQADLLDNLQSPRPFTLFIPVNEAVQKLNDSTFMNDKKKLRNFINYHMVNGTYYSNGIINNEFLLTNYEKEIKLQVVSDSFAKSLSSINGNVRILKSDITLTNGVAHVIDKCITEDTSFYVYPLSDEFRQEYGVMKRSFRVTSEEKNISNGF